MTNAFRRAVPPLLLLLVCLVLAGCGSSTSSPLSSAPAATTAPLVPTASGGGSGGPYPTPQVETFQGCPPQGDGGDSQLNIRKNRIDVGQWQQASVASLVELPYPAGVVKTPRAAWSSSDAADVAQNEGRPVQAEGYMLFVRHEGTESPNCHDANARDFHMWLAGSPGSMADRAHAMVVEVTPRVRALNSGWQSDLRLLGLIGQHVRISGWLLLDQEHPEQVGKTRGTLWEIHPIMQIEVEQHGRWINLNDPSLHLTGAPSATHRARHRATPTPTPTPSSHHRRRHHSSS
jgi:hypothetical protein